MEESSIPRVIEAQRLKNGVLITYENGECAEYLAALLDSMLPKVDELIDDLSDQD